VLAGTLNPQRGNPAYFLLEYAITAVIMVMMAGGNQTGCTGSLIEYVLITECTIEIPGKA
jgi:hypothetical protein